MLWIISAIILFYYLLIKPLSYWKENGVKQTSIIKSLSTNWCSIVRRRTFSKIALYLYNLCPGERFLGIYQFYRPVLVVRDPELIKQILIKDFKHFTEHVSFMSMDVDPLWSRNLFSLTGQKWKYIRAAFLSMFATIKLKTMYAVICDSSKKLITHLENKNEDLITVDMFELLSRFSTDLMFALIFGVEVNCLENPNHEAYLMAKEASSFGKMWKNFKILIFFGVPKIYNFLNLKMYKRDVRSFFRELTDEIVRRDKSGNKHGTDMVSLILEVRKGINNNNNTIYNGLSSTQILKNGTENIVKEITNDDITSNCINILNTAVHTGANAVSFALHELALNQNIQNKLRQEIQKTNEIYGDDITYEALMRMTYLHMFILEVLRKWPLIVLSDRTCTIPYTIQPSKPDEKPVHIEKGTMVWFSIFGLHHDAQYYPDPERFDPERFSEENKPNLNMNAFLPFGAGPRGCLGNKLSTVKLKTIFYYILTHFEIVPVKETKPIELNRNSVTLLCEGQVWLGLKRVVKQK